LLPQHVSELSAITAQKKPSPPAALEMAVLGAELTAEVVSSPQQASVPSSRFAHAVRSAMYTALNCPALGLLDTM
jgi:hypothetical protein